MSTYDNCVDGLTVRTGILGECGGTDSGCSGIRVPGVPCSSSVVVVQGGTASGSWEPGRAGLMVLGETVGVKDQVLGIPLQIPGKERTPCGPSSTDSNPPRRPAHGPLINTRLLVSVPRQCRLGDSIGFGDNSSHVLYRVQLETRLAQVRGPAMELRDGDPRHAARTKRENNPRRSSGSTTWNHTWANTEESVLIRSVEGYEPDCEGEGAPGVLQSPTFFPTQLEICEDKLPSSEALRFPGDSEDEDYYDNGILPFYETVGPDPEDRPESPDRPGPDHQSPTSQETDRLRNQLKEAYYLLITAMNDISLDPPPGTVGSAERPASSSCSTPSRDSLCSCHSAANTDSNSWSSEGDRSPLRRSDAGLLLHRLAGSLERPLAGRRSTKSLTSLSSIKIKPALWRSASEGGLGRPPTLWPCTHPAGPQELDVCLTGATVTSGSGGAGGRTGPQESRQVGRDRGGIVCGLAGSSDRNTETLVLQGQDLKRGQTLVLVPTTNSFNKGHGVTVNKMQEWMHRGRVLSSAMKQRIEGSSSPRGGGQNQDPGSSSSGRTTKEIRTRSPSLQQHPVSVETVQPSSEPASWRPQLTTITVSKKRSWLQQSSLRNPCAGEELQGMLGAEDQGHQLPPCPSTDRPGPPGGARSQPVGPQLPQADGGEATVPPPLSKEDPSEENDADDEGEIWYNPIPEDEELDAPRYRSSRGGPLAPGPGGRGASVLSRETHRQTACRPQDDGGGAPPSRPTDMPEPPGAVSFSPPSSPNPAKKSSAINWSFPDKIKSPRTVRKISMKMKKLPELSRKLSVKGTQSGGGGGPDAASQTSVPHGLAPPGSGQASRNVISRYHLDSSVSTPPSLSKKKSGAASRSASRGGYLSDGDSPELVAKSGKHGPAEGKGARAKEADGAGGGTRLTGTELDTAAFRHYSSTEQPRCSRLVSGLMSLHFYGVEDLKPPRVDSRDVYCAIQVDSVNKARTALLTCRTAFLDMDHTFNIELENAQHLKLLLFSWEPPPRRTRICCHGTVALPALFRVTRSHQLAVKLEPRGLIYVKLGLMERRQNSPDGGPDGDREPRVFGVEAWRVVERENSGLMVPLLISKCINEIEKRGCQVVGLYRLCGSAAVKKELREAFERNSDGVELSEKTYPDINVITGVLKDYLRELPGPLITKQLYQAVLEAMAARPLRMGGATCENDHADSEHAVGLLDHLPEVERMTLRRLLDHLKLVAWHQEVNKMTCQNLAVCFGPVLLSQRQEASCHSNRVFLDSEELASALHFKKHIEVLHYLLQLWPVVDRQALAPSPAPASPDVSAPPLRRKKERPQVLNLTDSEMAGVLRPKPGRLDSPSNRYAGDWSGCGESYFSSDVLLPPSKGEADYDDVASEETAGERREDAPDGEVAGATSDSSEQEASPIEDVEEDRGGERPNRGPSLAQEGPHDHILPPRLSREHAYQTYMKIQDIGPVLSNRVNLRDLQESIDTLIGNLERELNKNKLNVGY